MTVATVVLSSFWVSTRPASSLVNDNVRGASAGSGGVMVPLSSDTDVVRGSPPTA
ncbi:hypothetical protein [Amycolatopsis deserti]|uniref:hypothetical protein n=1 Tax=Amycolatopsis deserti TaxID=185696 RepID=UPI00402BD1D3